MSANKFDAFSAWVIPHLPKRFQEGRLPYLFFVVWLLIAVMVILAITTPYLNGVSAPLAFAGVLLLLQVLFAWGMPFQVAVNIGLVVAALEVGYTAWMSGGIFSPRMAWLAAMPLIPFYAVNRLVGLVWWGLHRTDMGKSVRASAEDPEIATAFGIHAKRLGIWLAGLCAALAACAGVCVALMFTLAPSQIYAWVGAIFAVVMIGRLGSALTPLVGGLVIGIIESMTMALIAPTWAPLVAFSVLILILLLRRGHE